MPADDTTIRLGVNCWPPEQAMDGLAAYDPASTRQDFGRARSAGLLWCFADYAAALHGSAKPAVAERPPRELPRLFRGYCAARL